MSSGSSDVAHEQPLASGPHTTLDRRLQDLRLRVGFGTAWLPRDDLAARRIIEAAVDGGMRYFDTARMYGSGHAERQLGKALRGLPRDVRSEIVVTTKLGILPQSDGLAARAARKLAPALGIEPPRFTRPRFGAFSPPAITSSVDASLEALGLDHLDIVLLHEVAPEHLGDQTLDHLAALQRSGKVGRLGLATGPVETTAILGSCGSQFDVVQIADHAWRGNAEQLLSPDRLLVTHSQLIGAFRQLRLDLANDADRRRTWSQSLEFDPLQPGALAGMLLRYALAVNPSGIVLFSTTNPEHLHSNIKWLSEGPLESERVLRLRELIVQ